MDDIAPPYDSEDDLFSFETDHLALKGNEDYCEVLKTLVVLAAQREKALQDYKTVAELRLEALKNPIEALTNIKNDTFPQIPLLLELPKLPVIDFQKYKVKVLESDLNEIYSRESKVKSEENSGINKPNPTNNRSWTPEEQKRLEELLQVFPPEPVEMKRFHKIAKALGNRTVQQVASRIQKYFLKLYKAGLPIPGRIPKSAEKFKRSSLHKHQRHNHYLWKPTTFFPELNVPVQMTDLENIPGPSDNSNSSNVTIENYLMSTDYHNSKLENPADLQLKLLKRVREFKLHEQSENYIPFTHWDFKCDYCEETPIKGARWHCTMCPESIDYCTDCVVSQLYTESAHPLTHWLSCHQDDTETLFNQTVGQDFDKQIKEELKGKNFEMHLDDKESDGVDDDDDDDES
ncbi:hypothetical protein ABEB36_001770 [Hypothenemus hampei]|uniref:ZZ-type zinc finger-containing protein 3 n=1 Tax=Hypothenemus hampei TaxID=57062 RepID=A0ABD1FFP5_HYPHA